MEAPYLILLLLSITLCALIIKNKFSKENSNRNHSKHHEISADYLNAMEYVNHLTKVKGVASEILSGQWCDTDFKHYDSDDPMDISPWDDFAYSMLRNPELVKFNFDKCPDCENDRFQIYHLEQGNENIGNYILLCPSCKKYFCFKSCTDFQFNNKINNLQINDIRQEEITSDDGFTAYDDNNLLKQGEIKAYCRKNYDPATNAKESIIEIEKYYNVDYAIIGRSWSKVCLTELPDKTFSSILFTYYIDGEEINIIEDYRSIKKLSNISREVTTIVIYRELSNNRIAQIRQRHGNIRIINRPDILNQTSRNLSNIIYRCTESNNSQNIINNINTSNTDKQ